MTVDIYSTQVLNKVVQNLKRPDSFLLDLFFPFVQESDQEEIYFDIDESKPRITPLVSPLVAGRVVQSQGFRTKSFKPAYAKDKRRHDPKKVRKRLLGETIGGEMTPMQRREAALIADLEDQTEMLMRREVVMASEALRLGQVTVKGEDYPTVVVDFERDAALTEVLTTTYRWGEAGVSPLQDLKRRQALIQKKSGAAARTVVMDPEAAIIFTTDPEVREVLDNRRGGESSLNLGLQTADAEESKGIYLGRIGDTEFYQYSETYLDDDGAEQNLMPDYTVVMGSRRYLEGTRCYGMIEDEEAEFKATRNFTKSWLEKDPSVRWLLMQSAPLMVPYRSNASFCLTVR